METNPLSYGLPTRVQLESLGADRLGIRKIVKSRIIQKDAQKIVEIATKIKSVNPNIELALICTRNICSKSLTLLQQKNIGIQFVEESSNKGI